MSIIEASSVRVKTLVDGTLRVEFDVEPRNAKDAFALFGAPGTPAALAALRPVAEPPPPDPAPKPRMAPLCQWAVMRCQEEPFQNWAIYKSGITVDPFKDTPENRERAARDVVCRLCQVESRKDIDGNKEAERRFHSLVREPFMRWMEHGR